MPILRNSRRLSCLCIAAACTMPLAAKDHHDERGWRYRIAVGPQLVPSYPGSDRVIVRPFVEIDRARTGQHFVFDAPDESFGLAIWRTGSFEVGPSFHFQGSRTATDVGAAVRKVDFTFEAGGFVQYHVGKSLRLRADLRKGLGGHDGLISVISADYVGRKGDTWLFSIGPRATFGNDRYHRAYFGIDARDAATSGLPVYRAKGGLESVGGTAGLIHRLSPHWGLQTYAAYGRLLGNSSRSPLVTQHGSRDQFSGGFALSYTFGR